MTICQLCKKQVATVHYTELDANYKVKRETHLCESCAQTHGLQAAPVQVVSPQQVLESFLKPNLPQAVQEFLETRCEKCGMTYAEFRSGGRFGCPEDYRVFRRAVMGLLEQIHGAREHRGKVPRRAGARIRLERRRGRLRQSLERAVAREDYEEAARLRDELKQVEAELEQLGKGREDD